MGKKQKIVALENKITELKKDLQAKNDLLNGKAEINTKKLKKNLTDFKKAYRASMLSHELPDRLTNKLETQASIMVVVGILVLLAHSPWLGTVSFICETRQCGYAFPLWTFSVGLISILILIAGFIFRRAGRMKCEDGQKTTHLGNFHKRLKFKCTAKDELDEVERVNYRVISQLNVHSLIVSSYLLISFAFFNTLELGVTMLFWGILLFLCAHSTNRKYGFTKIWSRNRMFMDRIIIFERELEYKLDTPANISAKLNHFYEEASINVHKDVVDDYVNFGNAAFKIFSFNKPKS